MSHDGVTLHATCLVVGEDGILIRGTSGAGKSSLALDLIDRATTDGRFARLVCDDRVRVSARAGRLVARAVPAIAGRLELRGIGIVEVSHEPACILRLVIDLAAEPPRMPEPEACRTELLGVRLPCLTLDVGMARRVLGLLTTRAWATRTSPPRQLHCDKDDALVTVS